MRDLIEEYESCCREIEELRRKIQESIKTNVELERRRRRPVSRSVANGRREAFEDSFKALKLASPEFTLSQGVWVSSPVDEETRRMVRIEEQRMKDTRARMDIVLEDIVDTLPRNAAQAADKILFLLNFIYLSEGVEIDYFIFSVIEAAIVIKNEVAN